jgi:2-dehydro-3-deoxy-D-arabinonate dehydratase
MRIIRFQDQQDVPVLAALTNESDVYILPYEDFMAMTYHAEEQGITPLTLVKQIIEESDPLNILVEDLNLLAPIVAPEVWAAGVTYEKSKEARNYEATNGKLDSQTFYDKVYDAKRPELFIKSTAARTVGPNQVVCIRSDSNWQIPEPELGLVINKEGKILGYTIGNDMSSRDIEGENPLYLPQAKIWRNSCSIGPAILLEEAKEDPYQFEIICRIFRNEVKVVEETANTNQLKRKYDELVCYLIKDNVIFDGTILLTGTCAVPPNEFTLQEGDRIEIEISEIGVLINPVKQVSQLTSKVG